MEFIIKLGPIIAENSCFSKYMIKDEPQMRNTQKACIDKSKTKNSKSLL